jgi:hypothetical protein
MRGAEMYYENEKKKYVPAVRQWPESYTRTAEMGALSFLIKRSG